MNAADHVEIHGCGSLMGGTFKVEKCEKRLPYICEGAGDRAIINRQEEPNRDVATKVILNNAGQDIGV